MGLETSSVFNTVNQTESTRAFFRDGRSALVRPAGGPGSGWRAEMWAWRVAVPAVRKANCHVLVHAAQLLRQVLRDTDGALQRPGTTEDTEYCKHAGHVFTFGRMSVPRYPIE